MALALEADEVHVWSTETGAGDLLRQVLARYLDREPDEIELRYGPHGKPRLAGRSRLRFNLSHSGGLTLVAIAADREVGVDVEAIVPSRDFERLAKRWLGEEAAAKVLRSAAGERAMTFYSAWARHEAIVKCHGGGLGAPAASQPVSVVQLDAGESHAVALAVAGAVTPTVSLRSPPTA